jgi:hypothetical protein
MRVKLLVFLMISVFFSSLLSEVVIAGEKFGGGAYGSTKPTAGERWGIDITPKPNQWVPFGDEWHFAFGHGQRSRERADQKYGIFGWIVGLVGGAKGGAQDALYVAEKKTSFIPSTGNPLVDTGIAIGVGFYRAVSIAVGIIGGLTGSLFPRTPPSPYPAPTPSTPTQPIKCPPGEHYSMSIGDCIPTGKRTTTPTTIPPPPPPPPPPPECLDSGGCCSRYAAAGLNAKCVGGNCEFASMLGPYASGWEKCGGGGKKGGESGGPSPAQSTPGIVPIGEIRIERKATLVCSGYSSLFFSSNPVSVNSLVQAHVSGLSNCNGKTIYIKDDKGCNFGKTICSCISSSTGCSCLFTSPSKEGDYTYYACIDKNNDGDFSDEGESTSAILRVIPSLLSCRDYAPIVTILNGMLPSGANLTVNILIQCSDWKFEKGKDLSLRLLIDNNYWQECEINEKRISKDLGWDIEEADFSSEKCKKGMRMTNGKWYCDNNAYCKHEKHAITIFSDAKKNFVNVTFTCKLPPLAPGAHTLGAYVLIYS